MATGFTVFEHLITELRLVIWQMALPSPPRRALYPYRWGYWQPFDRMGRDGTYSEYLGFNFSLVEPLPMELPLYLVSHEARSVALQHAKKHNLVLSRNTSVFLRSFDSSTDTIFLPTKEVQNFLQEGTERLFEPDMHERESITSSGQAFPRLAIMRSGFEAFKPVLASYFNDDGFINVLYIIDVEPGPQSELRDTPRARALWTCPRREWTVTAEDDEALAEMKELMEGLDTQIAELRRDVYTLEFQLVNLD